VEPAIDRLPLSDGDWLDVKRDLTTGEQRAMFVDMRRRFAPGETPMVDPMQVGIARLLAYVVGWSLTDKDNRPVPVSAGAIDQLHPDEFNEMREAIDAHERRQETARSEEKKRRAIATTSDRVLQSVG
jgi:hypothetical protein